MWHLIVSVPVNCLSFYFKYLVALVPSISYDKTCRSFHIADVAC